MSPARDLTRWRWVALALQAVSLGIMAAPTLPYATAYQDADSKEILTQVDHISWFNPLAGFGGANFAAWGAIAAVLIAGVLTVLAAQRLRAGRSGPYRSPMVVTAVATVLAVIALVVGGGASLWGWVGVALLVGATIANFFPTRPAGRPLLPGQPPR